MKHFLLGQSYTTDSLKYSIALRLQLSNEIFWKMDRFGWSSMKSCPVFYTPLPSQVSYKAFLWEK